MKDTNHRKGKTTNQKISPSTIQPNTMPTSQLTGQPALPHWEARLEQQLWQAWQWSWGHLPTFMQTKCSQITNSIQRFSQDLLSASTLHSKTEPTLTQACYDKRFWIAHTTYALTSLSESLPHVHERDWQTTIWDLINLVEPKLISGYHLHWWLSELVREVESHRLTATQEAVLKKLIKNSQRSLILRLQQHASDNYLADMTYWIQACLQTEVSPDTIKAIGQFYIAIVPPNHYSYILEKLSERLKQLKEDTVYLVAGEKIKKQLTTLKQYATNTTTTTKCLAKQHDISQASQEKNMHSASIKSLCNDRDDAPQSKEDTEKAGWLSGINLCWQYLISYPAQAITWGILLQTTAVAALSLPRSTLQQSNDTDNLTLFNNTYQEGLANQRYKRQIEPTAFLEPSRFQFKISLHEDGSRFEPVVAQLGQDQLVIAWSGDGKESNSSTLTNIYYRRMTFDGNWIDNEEQLANTFLPGTQRYLDILSINETVTLFAWRGFGPDSIESRRIYLRRLNSDGTWYNPMEILASTHSNNTSQFHPKLTRWDAEVIVVSWTTSNPSSLTQTDTYLRLLAANGTWLDKEERLVNSYTKGYQGFQQVTKINNCTTLITWEGEGPSSDPDQANLEINIYFRRLHINGTWLDPVERIVNTGGFQNSCRFNCVYYKHDLF